jgi:PTS system glucose-specific IIA component
MFGLLRRKIRDIHAPVDGQVIALESVNDAVFSQKMVGDGVAITPITSSFQAPIEGVVSKIFPTNHAYSIKSNKDLEVMVHIGIDTVELGGKGFRAVASEGDCVAVGDVIIEVDLEYLRACNKDTTTPIIILENSDVKKIEKRYQIVKASDKMMEVQ